MIHEVGPSPKDPPKINGNITEFYESYNDNILINF